MSEVFVYDAVRTPFGGTPVPSPAAVPTISRHMSCAP